METIFKTLFPGDSVIPKAGNKYTPEEWGNILVDAWIHQRETGDSVKLSVKKSLPKSQRRLLGREFRRKQEIEFLNESRPGPESIEVIHRAIAQLPKKLRITVNDHYFNNSKAASRRQLDAAHSALKELICEQVGSPEDLFF